MQRKKPSAPRKKQNNTTTLYQQLLTQLMQLQKQNVETLGQISTLKSMLYQLKLREDTLELKMSRIQDTLYPNQMMGFNGFGGNFGMSNSTSFANGMNNSASFDNFGFGNTNSNVNQVQSSAPLMNDEVLQQNISRPNQNENDRPGNVDNVSSQPPIQTNSESNGSFNQWNDLQNSLLSWKF